MKDCSAKPTAGKVKNCACAQAALRVSSRAMIRRDTIEADVVRLIINTREKFPHTPPWDAALKHVVWRYTGTSIVPEQKAPPAKKRTRQPTARRLRKPRTRR